MNEQVFLEFTLNFNIRQTRLNKPTIIYALFSFRGKQYKVNIGVKVYPSQWNKRKQIATISNGQTRLDNRNNEIVNKRIRYILAYFEENKRPFHNFGNSIVRASINALFKNDIKDIMTGYRAFSYRFVKTFPVLSKGFEIETEMSIHAIDKNMYVENVVIEYRDRPQGSESKLNTYSDGFKVIKTIIKLFRTYRPMGFFGLISVILFLLAMVFVIPVVVTYVKTGLVPNFPTLIVCYHCSNTVSVCRSYIANNLSKEQAGL